MRERMKKKRLFKVRDLQRAPIDFITILLCDVAQSVGVFLATYGNVLPSR